MPLLLFHLPNLMQASLLSRIESQVNLARSSEKCGPQGLAPLIKRRTEKRMEINLITKTPVLFFKLLGFLFFFVFFFFFFFADEFEYFP